MRKIWKEDIIKKYIESNNYTYIEMIEEKGLNSRIKIKCPKGHIYEVSFKNFKGNKAKKGTRCPECSNNKKPDYEQIKEMVEKKGFKLISKEYINSKDKLEIECKNGHRFYRTKNILKRGNNIECPYCSGGRESIDIFVIKNYLEKNNLQLLSKEYINAHQELRIKCKNGHIFKRDWSHLKTQKECPYCKASKGEKKIMAFLDSNNISYFYDEEYFEDLIGVGGNPLRPDFIIPKKRIWIEYDGGFHYDNKLSKERFEKLKIHDERKNIYAKENNWELIRIPYWDFENIENILIKKMNL